MFSILKHFVRYYGGNRTLDLLHFFSIATICGCFSFRIRKYLRGSTTVSGSSTIPVKAQTVTPATTNSLLIRIIVIVVILAVIAGVLVMKRGKKKGGPKPWQEPAKEKPEEEKK